MRIGIDASRTTVARRTGTESYALRLIRALLAEDSAHDFILYFRDAPPPGLFSRGVQRVIPLPRLWTHARLSLELLGASRPDVLYVPAHVLPLMVLAGTVPAVVTLHDLGYLHFPDAHPLAQRLYLDGSTRFSARAATHVITDSQATRRDLMRFYRIAPDKMTVVYPGRDESLRRVDPTPVRAKYGLTGEYLLHVGTLQPRKNLLRLIEAVLAVRHSQFSTRIVLVLAGRPGWLAEPILAKAREHADAVRLLAYVPDDDLAGLYSGACALVFPSLYEGFGFPLLEAMACGTPVICSNAASLPELAGDPSAGLASAPRSEAEWAGEAAALLVDPTDTSALASAILRVLSEPGLRAALIERGLAQVQKFSWAKAARETLAVLEAAASARKT